MDVLLTHGYFIGEDAREQEIMRPYPPLGLLYNAGYLRSEGFAVDVFDSTFSSKQALMTHLLENPPKILAMYANLMTKINLLEIIRFVRNNDQLSETTILLGGPDVTYNQENYLRSGADILVIGEGEQTLAELSNAILTGKEMGQISGIAFKKGDQLVQTPPRAKMRSLEELPLPARDMIDMEAYLNAWKSKHGKSAMSISTQRGCPYTCQWCSTAVYGQSYRRRPAVQVADEIELLIKTYAPDSFWFVDDVFTVSHKWLASLHEEFQNRGLSVAFECITRAERLNDEVWQMLKEMGCIKVWIGAESGSQRIINAMDRRVEVEVVREQIRRGRDYEVATGTFIMLGYPGETLADIRETVHHLKASNPDEFTITVSYPIAGTELYNQVKDKLIDPPDWNQSTDRDLDFERTYSRKFYDHAVRYVVNSVQASKAWKDDRSFVKWSWRSAKSVTSRIRMILSK